MKSKTILILVALLYLCGLFSITTFANETSPGGVNFVPFQQFLPEINCLVADFCKNRFQILNFLMINTVGNILIFMPLGFLLAFLFQNKSNSRILRISIVLGLFLSFSIELTQLNVPGRVFDVTDLILNTAGSFCGALLALKLDEALKEFKTLQTYS